MGAWGFGSDENDETYDLLGLGIMDRVYSGKLTTKGRRLMKEHFDNMSMEDKTPGVVMWLLKQGVVVSKVAMQNAIVSLENEDIQDWLEESEEREKEIKKEVKMLKKAIAQERASTRVKTKDIMDSVLEMRRGSVPF
jgi:regulator of replication initiation timing